MSSSSDGEEEKGRSRKYLRVTMPDGSKWDVLVDLIAENKALYYALKEPDNDKRQAIYIEEKKLMLEGDDYDIEDWASNNMNWSDVEKYAVYVSEDKEKPDFQEGWMNGDKEIVEY